MAYSDKVVDHFTHPRNMGSFPKEDPQVGTGMVGAPECGDVMKLQIKVQDDTIVDAKFKTFGCGSAIASSSLATEWLKGKTLADASQDQEHGHCARAESATGQDSLLCSSRRCHQGRLNGFPTEAACRSDGSGAADNGGATLTIPIIAIRERTP